MDGNDYKTCVLRLLGEKKSQTDQLGHELRISLLSAALNSYRCDSILKPFPNQYVTEEEKMFDFVKRDLNSIPALSELNEDYQMSDNCWQLLHWAITLGSFQLILRPISSQQITNILNENQSSMKNFKPTLIFEVVSQPKRSFMEAKERFGTFWAFHGSAVENFHSILHNGLVNCLNKRALYGSGTYVSSQLSVAIEFSPFGFGWNKSLLGKEISCVAVCQVLWSSLMSSIIGAQQLAAPAITIQYMPVLCLPSPCPLTTHFPPLLSTSLCFSFLL
ncbi:unnamed protein product [Medioppia subpectinata]|uniref:Poly [ADP-ribose] polymerase n=1 Tax=Medioppia subpectinata TaxID=1979941 RepID=A0A7R9KVM2_9ACAR|nr:unnamed protein product [Medioppia subpectinata]CAG2109571.1 unnamed protein product [Medioppia subpectinata]